MGFDIQIRIVSEVAGNGNELADPKTMSMHCVAFEGKKTYPSIATVGYSDDSVPTRRFSSFRDAW